MVLAGLLPVTVPTVPVRAEMEALEEEVRVAAGESAAPAVPPPAAAAMTGATGGSAGEARA